MATTVIDGTETTGQKLDTGDTLLVTRTGLLHNTAGSAIFNASSFNATVQIHGEVYGADNVIDLNSNTGTSAGSGFNVIQVGATGLVSSLSSLTANVIDLLGSNNEVHNAGTISGTGNAIYAQSTAFGSALRVDNSGSIWSEGQAGVFVDGTTSASQSSIISNSGDIAGGLYGLRIEGLGITINNTGTIRMLTPTASAGTAVKVTGASANIYNTGLVEGYEAIEAESVTLENHGTIRSTQGQTGIALDVNGSAATEIHNHGVIIGRINTGSLIDRIYDSGRINGNIDLGIGNDVYVQYFGSTSAATIFGGNGNDAMEVRTDEITIYGGGDFDTVNVYCDYELTSGTEQLNMRGTDDLRAWGGNTDNVMYGNRGDNKIFARGGIDTIFGGDGDDLLRGGTEGDSIEGGEGFDILRGGADNDYLKGDGDDDVLHGGFGNDDLFGGDGEDIIIGGRGKDRLRGGAESDTFLYRNIKESGNSQNAAERIFDFELGIDTIDLSRLAQGSFVFLGTGAFSGTGGAELRVSVDSGNSYVRIDKNGDGAQDMMIRINNVTGMDDSDFIL